MKVSLKGIVKAVIEKTATEQQALLVKQVRYWQRKLGEEIPHASHNIRFGIAKRIVYENISYDEALEIQRAIFKQPNKKDKNKIKTKW